MAETRSTTRRRVMRLLCFFLGHEEGNESFINEPFDDRVYVRCRWCHKMIFLYDAGELARKRRQQEARDFWEYISRR